MPAFEREQADFLIQFCMFQVMIFRLPEPSRTAVTSVDTWGRRDQRDLTDSASLISAVAGSSHCTRGTDIVSYEQQRSAAPSNRRYIPARGKS